MTGKSREGFSNNANSQSNRGRRTRPSGNTNFPNSAKLYQRLFGPSNPFWTSKAGMRSRVAVELREGHRARRQSTAEASITAASRIDRRRSVEKCRCKQYSSSTYAMNEWRRVRSSVPPHHD